MIHTENSRVEDPGAAGKGEGVRTGRHHTQIGAAMSGVDFINVYLCHIANTHTHTHTHTPVSYTHLTLPTNLRV